MRPREGSRLPITSTCPIFGRILAIGRRWQGSDGAGDGRVKCRRGAGRILEAMRRGSEVCVGRVAGVSAKQARPAIE